MSGAFLGNVLTFFNDNEIALLINVYHVQVCDAHAVD